MTAIDQPRHTQAQLSVLPATSIDEGLAGLITLAALPLSMQAGAQIQLSTKLLHYPAGFPAPRPGAGRHGLGLDGDRQHALLPVKARARELVPDREGEPEEQGWGGGIHVLFFLSGSIGWGKGGGGGEGGVG